MAEEQYADEFQMNKDVSIIFYQNGIPTNFEIPSRPGQPRATNISYQSVTLNWSKPIYGSLSVQRYKIYGQINANTQWILFLTTMDATESAAISNLVKGKYRFEIHGITLAGDTTKSDVGDEIG